MKSKSSAKSDRPKPPKDWFRAHQGEGNHLPQSGRQGQHLMVSDLVPLRAQIAVFFGVMSGDLESLQAGVMKLSRGEPVACQECGRDIYKEKHKADCEIVRKYQIVKDQRSKVLDI